MSAPAPSPYDPVFSVRAVDLLVSMVAKEMPPKKARKVIAKLKAEALRCDPPDRGVVCLQERRAPGAWASRRRFGKEARALAGSLEHWSKAWAD